LLFKIFFKCKKTENIFAFKITRSICHGIVRNLGVNFINILRTHFLYKSALHCFTLVMFWHWQNYESTFVQKNSCKMLMKLITAGMMPPEMLHEAGLTRIVGSGACLTRNPALKSQVQVGNNDSPIILCRSLINFNNILPTVFSPIPFRQNIQIVSREKLAVHYTKVIKILIYSKM
jgi:hypothetical protein